MDERTRKVMMSSKSHEWFTPRNIFDPLHKKYNFTTDPCTSANNPLKLRVFYTEEQLEGPVKLLEHIHEHCPEREKNTKEWLQLRGLLPEEDDQQQS
jgi:hypothetical protein